MSEREAAEQDDVTEPPFHVAFVCVQNAGRSQMATAFAERERQRRGLEDAVEVHTGGTDPADGVHDGVVEAMAETDVDEYGTDLAEREPRAIATQELEACDVVATMGCSTLELDADRNDVDGNADGDGDERSIDLRDWALADPDGEAPERVREIRDEIEARVGDLFDEVERELESRSDRDAGDASGATADE